MIFTGNHPDLFPECTRKTFASGNSDFPPYVGATIGVLWACPAPPSPQKAGWNWPDSLDAVRAVPHNHKILFENNKIRILEVILEPYAYDPTNHRYFAKDSIRQHHGGQPNQPDTGNYMKPEGPHRIKNLGDHRMVVYRVEMK